MKPAEFAFECSETQVGLDGPGPSTVKTNKVCMWSSSLNYVKD